MRMTRQLVTQAEFARIISKDKGHITRLKQAGRLVFDETGKLVDVEASIAKIQQTADPAHANSGENAKPNASYSHAKARREMAMAEQAELELAKMRGNLVDAEEARLFGANIGATFRSQLEALPDRLAAELAPISDADQVRAMLVENFEALLGEVSRVIEKGMES